VQVTLELFLTQFKRTWYTCQSRWPRRTNQEPRSWANGFFKIEGFTGKRSLLSPPPPPSFSLFAFAPIFARSKCEQLLRAARISFASYGNASYAGYIQSQFFDFFFLLHFMVSAHTSLICTSQNVSSKFTCTANCHNIMVSSVNIMKYLFYFLIMLIQLYEPSNCIKLFYLSCRQRYCTVFTMWPNAKWLEVSSEPVSIIIRLFESSHFRKKDVDKSHR